MRDSRGARAASAALGAQVRRARRGRGVTVRGLAGLLDVSPATISQIENGHTGLSASRLSHIADALGTTVSEILNSPTRGADSPPKTADTPPETTNTRSPSPPPGTAPHWPQFTHWRAYEPLEFDPVLHAALDEFVEIGYHGATVRSIAARSGFSVSGIYHYYTSKQQMLVAILERAMTELLARAKAAQSEGRDPVQRFSLQVEHLALFHTHRRELGFVGASEMRSLEQPSRRAIAEMRTAQQRMVDDEVRAAVRLGEFRNDHPHEAARATVTLCTALANWWRPEGHFSPEQTAEQYVEFSLAMMRGTPGSTSS
ncbi:helix-turn-helix domain-containing protein [Prauserella rugosa]|uniref:TetR family transcriptional regulator n=1 Tax=Prauserella rugosa TaxID=43354 RepID=A0A660CCS0_9PSEU|nr:helix-turn-helix domain-containing protein [Prauserella rugosa]KMS86613.1 hypothetical protein ACZ91_35810 [Streptomyces regensis]TWH18655.1 TetR family transcriptional regulator [Prauserella rugosa]